MKIKTQLMIAALLGVMMPLLALAGEASAMTFKQATFKATIKGVQTYEYSYDHASTDRCDPSINTHDTEKVVFKSTKPVKLTASQAGRSEPFFISGTKALRFPTKGTIDRKNSNSVSSVPEDCSGNGGGVGPGPPPDCGRRVVKPWWMTVDYYRRDHIELQPEDNAGRAPFENCGGGAFPYLLSGESFGRRSSAELPAKELFDPKIGKLITIGAGDEFIPMPEGHTETKIRWELSLTRVGEKAAGRDGKRR